MNKKIVFATHNPHKVQEVRDMLSPLGYAVFSLEDLHLKETKEETAETFEGNSKIKAEDIASQCTEIAVLADDSGLSIQTLDGFPGVHSARFMEGQGYLEKNKAILRMMEGKEDRRASFLTVLTYIDEKREKEIHFLGEDKGEIIALFPEGNQNGFGYDPIFYSYALKKTYGEASPEEKNSVSHRGRALRKLVAYLEGEEE